MAIMSNDRTAGLLTYGMFGNGCVCGCFGNPASTAFVKSAELLEKVVD